ncbi:NAD-dependent malic enzyme [Candidatus Legionella polyplacis]|uniref:NAD-dependent malic enzyme n=1 Tax=Candidatus Legionella polyplacis TaxID=2005262 RepID=UPI000C1E68D6|nr:NAD-dependent malic enzyme [Candidatus Legionella polyplacis]ATW01922.1 NAD-dependent malic enzyme [Candidatus Legionella polyplacis]
MLNYRITYNKYSNELVLETSIEREVLLCIPWLNKGTAFTHEERCIFSLFGNLPNRVETLEEQVRRAYLQYSNYKSNIQKYIYLNNLRNENYVLFYKLLSCYLNEMINIIYTPNISLAVENFNYEFRRGNGLYISFEDINRLDIILNNTLYSNIDIIIVTDGECVLGIGDQGIGGIEISVAKLIIYTVCGGINPNRILPVFLDVGTNNVDLLNNIFYLGYRHLRISVEDYNSFIYCFIDKVKKYFPKVFLHLEDLSSVNGNFILNKFKRDICVFNDDIQGTGAVTLAALLSALDITNQKLENQRIIIFGAGSAGIGISNQIVDAMLRLGFSKEKAFSCLWLIDKQGLLIDSDVSLKVFQKPYARKIYEILKWPCFIQNDLSLLNIIRMVRPTILIGTSGQYGAFSEKIIRSLCFYAKHSSPIIFALSNPAEKIEAHPEDIIKWSNGRAVVATGTFFPKVCYKNKLLEITQCNNAVIFPGIGLGISSVKARRLSENMIWSAIQVLRKYSPAKTDISLSLLPYLDKIQFISKKIAISVAETAIIENIAGVNVVNSDIEKVVENSFWVPNYLPYKKYV